MLNNKGFTLIEIIITTIIGAAIVILSLGHIMLTTQRYWLGGGREVELQRDLSLSMDWIKRALREAERVKILVGGESIEVRNPWGERKRFYREGNNLKVETTGESRVIVDNLTALSFFWGVRAIGIDISLSEYDLEVSARSAATLRNRPLAAEWLFDENAGGTLRDTSPNRNRGTISGATWSEGKHGSALLFEGNDYARVEHHGTLNLTEKISVGAWVNLQPTGRRQTIVEKVVPGQSGYQLAVTNCRRVFVEMRTEDGFQRATSINRILWGTWQAIGFSYDSYQIKFYINGQIDPRIIEHTGAIISNNQDLYIGSYRGISHWARGKIDEIRIAY